MEDVARFALDREDLCNGLKTLRHDLASALRTLPTDPIIARDTPNDVGTAIATAGEHARRGAHDIAAAAGKRLAEALRSIEEHAKALDVRTAARRIEQLRYRAYDIEQQLAFALGSARKTQWRLCVIITENICTRPWMEVARSALESGADCIQLREKEMADRKLLERARTLRALTHEHNAALIINDRPDIAALCEADGVHLGQGDLPIADARRIIGMERLIGASATTIEQARAAMREGADYLGLGPMFATATKAAPGGRTDGSLAGPDLIRAYLMGEPVMPPHLAIGGITMDNAAMLIEAGCAGAAVCAAICTAHDPGAATRELLTVLRANDPTVTVAQ